MHFCTFLLKANFNFYFIDSYYYGELFAVLFERRGGIALLRRYPLLSEHLEYHRCYNQRGVIPVRNVKFFLRLLEGRLEIDP